MEDEIQTQPSDYAMLVFSIFDMQKSNMECGGISLTFGEVFDLAFLQVGEVTPGHIVQALMELWEDGVVGMASVQEIGDPEPYWIYHRMEYED